MSSTAGPATTGSSTTAAPRPCSRDREPTEPTSPIAAATIGSSARPVQLTTSLPTGAIESLSAAGASGRPSATCAASRRPARARTYETNTPGLRNSSGFTNQQPHDPASPALARPGAPRSSPPLNLLRSDQTMIAVRRSLAFISDAVPRAQRQQSGVPAKAPTPDFHASSQTQAVGRRRRTASASSTRPSTRATDATPISRPRGRPTRP